MLKKLLFFVIALIILVALGLFVLVLSINPIIDKYKPEINAKITDALGQKASIGKASLQLFPNVGVAVDNVSIGDGTERSYIDKVVLHSGIKSLFKGQVSISKLSLEGGELKIRKEADSSLVIAGISLKEKMGEAKASKEDDSESLDSQAPESLTEDSSSPASGLSIQLSEADLKNITVYLQDKTATPVQNFQLDNISAKLTDFTTSPSGNASGSISFLGKENNNIQFSGVINPNSPISLSNLDVSLTSLDLTRLSKVLNAYSAKPSDLSISQSLKTDVTANFNDSSSGNLDIKFDATDANISFGDKFKKSQGDKLNLSAAADVKIENTEQSSKNTLNFKNINLNLGQSLINASLNIINESTKPASGKGSSKNKFENVKLSSKGLDFAEISKFLPIIQSYDLKGNSEFSLDINPDPLEVNGLGKLNSLSLKVPYGVKPITISDFSSDLDFEGNSLSLKESSLMLAGQKLKTNAKIDNFTSPKVTFDLSSENLNIQSLATEIGINQKSLEGAFLSNLKTSGNFALSSMSGDINISADKAEISKIPLNAINIKTKLTKDEVKILPSGIKSFGGSLDFFANMSLTGGKALNLSLKGDSFDSDLISKTFLPDSKFFLTGIIDSITANISSKLSNLIPGSSGSVKLKMGKGTIEGVNLFGESLGGVSGIPGLGSKLSKYVPEENQDILQLDHTPFDSLTFDSNLDNGRLNIRSFSLSHSIYSLEGDGYIGLADGVKSIQARISLSKLLAEKMIERHSKLRHIEDANGGIVFPIRISQSQGGKLIVVPDVQDLLKRAGRNAAKKEISKQIGKQLEKVSPGLGSAADALGGIFGGSKKSDSNNDTGKSDTNLPSSDSAEDNSKNLQPKEQIEKALGNAAGKALEGLFN